MSVDKVNIGNVQITSVSDGRVEILPSEFFPTVAADAWEPYRDQLTPDGKIVLNIGSFLLRSDGKTVLVDTGLGPTPQQFQDAVFGLLLEDMRSQGTRVEDVDMVVTTHLHGDHIGWNLARDDGVLRPTFPRARYWVPRKDWDTYARRAGLPAGSIIKEQVVPLEELGLLELMDGEQALTSEITALPTPGHTPGHTSVLISSQGEQGVILGDAAHIPAQAQETDWCPRADRDPEVSRATRRNLMDRMERDGSLVVSGHFPVPGFGRLVRLDGRRYWQAL